MIFQVIDVCIVHAIYDCHKHLKSPKDIVVEQTHTAL